MSSRRTERLLNLVICLLATRRWLTKEQIRLAVPQYADCESAEAFDRMFERDKEDLRDLGVPVVTGTDEHWFDDETGYRVDRDTYALPPIELDAEELAVVGLASRVWQQASLAGPAARALTKLTALGVETDDEGGPAGLEPRIRTAEPAFEPLYAATRDHQPVSFTYRKPTGEAAVREVEPWAVVSRSGRWYLIGHDRGRRADRVFRLSRIESNVRRVGRAGQYVVPDDFDPQTMLVHLAPPGDERIAVLRVRDGRGAGLRRRALDLMEPGAPDDPGSEAGSTASGTTTNRAPTTLGHPGFAGSDATDPEEPDLGTTQPAAPGTAEGWDEVRLRVGDPGGLAQELAGYGPDVIVLAPPDVREEVIRRLEAALKAQSPDLGGPDLVTDVSAFDPPAPDRGTAVTVGATARVSRLLAMVPWLLNRQGVPLEEAARHFDISQAQLVKDLELLFVCGMPGHMPDDLIEAEWDSGRVYLDNAEAIARPLRLAPDEAIALIAGLRTLADLPGPHDRRAVESALVKVSAAAQDAVGVASRLTIDLSAGAAQEALRTAREALRLRRRLRLTYVVPTRDETTERDVDLMRVTNLGGRWYLEAWCHRAEDVRLFRVDRVAGAQILDVDGTPPPEAISRDGTDQLFTPSDDDLLVTLEVEPRGRWVAEYYPVESTRELAGGRLRVILKVADPRWLPPLVLRLGGAGRIIDPPELATAAVDAAREALAHY